MASTYGRSLLILTRLYCGAPFMLLSNLSGGLSKLPGGDNNSIDEDCADNKPWAIVYQYQP